VLKQKEVSSQTRVALLTNSQRLESLLETFQISQTVIPYELLDKEQYQANLEKISDLTL